MRNFESGDPVTPTGPRGRARWSTTAILVGLILVGLSLFGLVARTHDASRSDERTVDAAVPTTTLTTPPSVSAPPVAPPPSPTTAAAAPVSDLSPLAVRIPAVGIESELIRLGLNPDQTLEVPEDYGVAGWYIHRPVPGEPGPAIIAGHVDSTSGPGVFYRLRELEPGATIEVPRSDGTTAVFTVTAKEQHDKDEFPTERVYGPTSSAELRVITCGGSFDRRRHSYNDNVIVFASLTRIV